jgi:hypothetical protein
MSRCKFDETFKNHLFRHLGGTTHNQKENEATGTIVTNTSTNYPEKSSKSIIGDITFDIYIDNLCGSKIIK